MYVDVHTHLFHERFAGEEALVIQRAREGSVSKIIVNGLDPVTNRQTLALCARHENLFPSLGIYPVDAACHAIDPTTWPHRWPPPERFDLDAEFSFIEKHASSLIAFGECGLDHYWLKDPAAMKAQEEVFRRFCTLSIKYDKPLILHSRKAERRCFEILREMKVKKANFHCFGGKAVLASEIAKEGYYFSIPPVVVRSKSFQAMVRRLPQSAILTETDAPYQGPVRGERNEPLFVIDAVRAIAKARNEEEESLRVAIWENFKRFFGDF